MQFRTSEAEASKSFELSSLSLTIGILTTFVFSVNQGMKGQEESLAQTASVVKTEDILTHPQRGDSPQVQILRLAPSGGVREGLVGEWSWSSSHDFQLVILKGGVVDRLTASCKLRDTQVSQNGGVPGWGQGLPDDEEGDEEAGSLPSACLPMASFPVCLPRC